MTSQTHLGESWNNAQSKQTDGAGSLMKGLFQKERWDHSAMKNPHAFHVHFIVQNGDVLSKRLLVAIGVVSLGQSNEYRSLLWDGMFHIIA